MAMEAEAQPPAQTVFEIVPNLGEDFVVGPTLTLYDAAMIYSGRSPGGSFVTGRGTGTRPSVEQLEIYLGKYADAAPFWSPDETEEAYKEKCDQARARLLSWDIYHNLLARIQKGQIKPTKSAYQPNGLLDLFETVICIGDLVQLASDRGDRPKSLLHLLHSPETHTGFAGRPSARALIDHEFQQRLDHGDLEKTVSGEAKKLVEKVAATHPTIKPPTPGTVENMIRGRFRKATK